MENNKETIWITIPEETIPPQRLPLEEIQENPEKVKNKAFWGAGFVALIVFTVMLFVPQQFASLLQGQLFDGGFQVIPDYEEQQGQGELFGGEEEVEEEITDTEDTSSNTIGTSTDNVVGAEEDAVTIQIEPLADTDAPVDDELTGDQGITSGVGSASGSTDSGEAMSAIADEETDEDEGTGEEMAGDEAEGSSEEGAEEATDSGTEEATEEVTAAESALEGALGSLGGITDASETGGATGTGTGAVHEAANGEGTGEGEEEAQTELEALAAELEEFKKMQEDNQALIAQLTQMLQGGGVGMLYGSAGTQTGSDLTGGANQFAQSGQTIGGSSVYRYNTHMVTVSPYDVLQQNQTVQSQVAQMQANVQYGGVQAYSNEAYNPVLSGVQGQPDTGPAESMMIAVLLVSVAVLIWGIRRAVRVKNHC